MADELPTEFDLIVIGTGFTESVVAAAASRIGKNVLHLDPNDFYGCNWASFNLDTLLKYVDAQTNGTETDEDIKIENDSMKLINNLGKLNNIEQKWIAIVEPKENPTLQPKNEIDISESEANVANDSEKYIKNVWTKETILKEFRKFNIDLIPKLLFSRGDLVELLISSNICRYAEFRAVDRVITLFDNALKSVPCSRSDVFTTKDVNVIEKRLLMKLLSNCLNFDDKNLDDKFQEYQNTTFHQYLKDENLTPHLIHYILYAISMSNEQTNCVDGIKNTKKFLSSLGRYGNTPFLFPMYGCGEIPQCFCRLCAVFGGVYCLKRTVSKINFTKSLDSTATDDNLLTFHSIECDEQTILAKNIVLGNGSVSKNIFPHNDEIVKEKQDKHCGKISRAIFITDRPLSNDENINSGGGGVIFLKMQSSLDSVGGQTRNDDGAFVIQLSHFSGTCPKELYLIHITCKQINDAATDLLPYVNKLFKITNDVNDNSEKPTILWSLYFNIKSCLKCEYQMNNTSTINSLHLCCGPYFELDYDKSILEAKNIFSKLYPNDEFLPRAPDPEEIIFGIGDEVDVVSAATDATNLTNILDIENNFDVGQLKENIADVVEAIENEEKCIEENSMNEIKGDD